MKDLPNKYNIISKSQASGNVRAMYNVSSTASSYYGDLEQEIQLIKFRENQCTNNSQRTYEVNTDKAYIDLQNCLVGLEPVPTKGPVITTSAASIATTLATSTDSTQSPIETSTETTTETNAPTTVSTRRTRRPRTSTTTSFYTTNSAGSGSQSGLSNELKKWLNSLRH